MTPISQTGREAVAEVLERAAELLTPEGAWQQREWGGNGCWCLDGAIMEAKGEENTFRELALVCEAVGCDSAIYWNDAPERTQAEVVAKLKEAAALAREQGL